MESSDRSHELRIPKDYFELLRELDSLELLDPVFSDQNKFERLGFMLDTLNKSYDIRGEAIVKSDIGIEIVSLPDEFQPELPWKRSEPKIYNIPNFEHQGYCLGFEYSVYSNQFVISFTDDTDPWNITRLKTGPMLRRTFHVPVSEPHIVSVVGGLTIERAA